MTTKYAPVARSLSCYVCTYPLYFEVPAVTWGTPVMGECIGGDAAICVYWPFFSHVRCWIQTVASRDNQPSVCGVAAQIRFLQRTQRSSVKLLKTHAPIRAELEPVPFRAVEECGRVCCSTCHCQLGFGALTLSIYHHIRCILDTHDLYIFCLCTASSCLKYHEHKPL